MRELAGCDLAITIGLCLFIQYLLFAKSYKSKSPLELGLTVGLMVLNFVFFWMYLKPLMPDATLIDILRGASALSFLLQSSAGFFLDNLAGNSYDKGSHLTNNKGAQMNEIIEAVLMLASGAISLYSYLKKDYVIFWPAFTFFIVTALVVLWPFIARLV